jgi:hypothetical protein
MPSTQVPDRHIKIAGMRATETDAATEMSIRCTNILDSSIFSMPTNIREKCRKNGNTPCIYEFLHLCSSLGGRVSNPLSRRRERELNSGAFTYFS